MDISAVVLNKLLLEKNLEIWTRLKLSFLDSAYSSVYSAISRHYEKYATLPTFEELEVVVRDSNTERLVSVLKLIDEPEITAEVALDALLDQYTQNEAVKSLDAFIDKLPVYDSQQIKDGLADIVLRLDDKTHTVEGVFKMSEIMLFKTPETLDNERVYLGLNNTFDSVLGGVALEELILVGGPRGSGKSITAVNVCVNQYEAGNSVVLFTIEMIAHEMFERIMAILANVDYMQLKKGTLTPEDLLKVVRARAGMFLDADDLVQEYKLHRDVFKFETELVRKKELKPDNQIIIIDDRALSLTSIDLHLGKLKAQFGKKLKVAVVDYLNQVVYEGGSAGSTSLDQFDWKQQVSVSKKLKELARKHAVVMFSPYQVDSTGEARFAKGILDAADIALVLEANAKEDMAMTFRTTKIRGGPELVFTSGISWATLRLSPIPIEAPAKKQKSNKKENSSVKTDEPAGDAPW